MSQKEYTAISLAKRLQRSEKIPKEWMIDLEVHEGIDPLDVPIVCGILTGAEIEITSKYDATSLLDGLKAGTWSVEQVTTAFCKRAAIAQQLVNCLTEIFFNEAIERARHLDKQRHACTDVKTLPPLFGLPVSLKDTFAPATSIAAMLLDLGAILFCKTNVPQSVMTGDSHNNVSGRTLNPRNCSFTAGGSTGGEGALLALRGSVLGVGTDIAGSIRVPCVCNGTFGMRPSVGIVPHGGTRELSVPGTDGVRSTVGPLATTFRDCALFVRTIMQAGTWRYDSNVVSLPWRYFKPKTRLRIDLVEDDGKAAHLLRMSEHVEVIPLTLPKVRYHYEDLLSYFTLPGNEHYLEQFGRTGEPMVPSLATIGLLSQPTSTLQGFFDLNVRRAEAAKTYLRLFLDNGLDAILMPAAPHTALPLDSWTNATYTGLWNYLDYPAAVIPVDVVTESDFVDDPNNAKYGPSDAEIYRLYTGPQHYNGLPIAVQVIGYRHQDEELIATTEMLDSIINKKG
ncbi:amidase [Trichoderma novae-zelandiae]